MSEESSQQAAQELRVALPKVRAFFDHCAWFARDAEIFRVALAELNAAEGKGEGRG